MDEEQINALSQLAEEIANQELDDIASPTATTEDTIIATFINEVSNMASMDRVDTTDAGAGFVYESEESDDSLEVPEDNRDFITPNVSTSVTDAATTRFSSAEWFEKVKQQSVIIAGLGGIGRFGNLVYFW